MSRVEAAAPDRLPWLQDEPVRRPVKHRGNPVLAGAAAAAMALVAAGAFWLGMNSVQEPIAPAPQTPATTITLPEPRETQQPQVLLPAQPEVSPAPAVEVRPAPVREVRIAVPPTEKSEKTEETTSVPAEESQPVVAAAPAKAPPPTAYVPPKPWNPRVFAGAAGRVVQIGAFGSTHQAKLGWRYMVRAYPAVARLPAVVRTTRNSKGRTFYRFQIGTTSQAHSEVLCQRMQRIHFSCAVVDLPWKTKVER